MKIYNKANNLQDIIEHNFNNQFENLFNSNILLKFDKDLNNNLILNSKEGAIKVDSSIAYQLSDYYKLIGNAIERIESISDQKPETPYKQIKELGILFNKEFISFTSEEFKLHKNAIKNNTEEEYVYDPAIIDSVGGIHDEGLGWNPKGNFCGECSKVTCENCISINNTEKYI